MKKNINVWTDGGARGNPGPAAIGVVIKEDDKPVFEHGRFIHQATNNQAEYMAVIEALEWLQSHHITSSDCSITFHLDSELVTHQLNGHYKVKHDNMKPLYHRVQGLIQSIGAITFTAIPRSRNKRADELVNEALDNKMVKG